MGVGMVAVVTSDATDAALALLGDRGVPAWVAGEIAGD
jgi:phosphoribosylformylglycinamidine cyclo-ligase